ncbi:hypothetical protein DVVG_00020 [Dunaliella viridis virus SI2]|uniref:hypothetical protein n=1 Tax=Dunaliella viridis virus SI2 TaxID=754069 RepID=UPI0002C0E912|nr:hypothetical protein DVVG_00020 [Dunaliella viridis virus SI2]AGH16006.1 hypothetical protein DVVG_00020 [Dunaliella viridis virus SI2]
MKTLIITTAALAIMATTASAQMLCEREVSFGANEVPGAERTFYAHGCDRFQYQPLTEHQVLNLGEHCSVESSADGGTSEEEIEIVEEVPYEVADGSVHHRDNLTSMGASVTTGQQVMRVRSATAGNHVSIRRAGGGEVWSGAVGAGDTMVQVGQAGTYIATTNSRRITKATGPQTFVDRTVTTETVTVEHESEARQPGPRTDRCGPLGSVVAAQ